MEPKISYKILNFFHLFSFQKSSQTTTKTDQQLWFTPQLLLAAQPWWPSVISSSQLSFGKFSATEPTF